MDLLLITGAGASRELGKPDDPLPLMPDWANALCTALDDEEPSLAAKCGLSEGMGGEQFEEALGLLLRWEQIKYLNSRYAGLTNDPGHFQTLDAQATTRLGTIRRVIDQTLYAQFGQHRVDDERATLAYKALLERLDVDQLVLATTNYDRACEAALSRLGRKPDAGFRSDDSESVPKLQVAGLVASARERGSTACLHLHGAVGWYQKDGVVYDFRSGHEYNETLGTPVVLYPDPLKDPTSDAHVAALWEEFRFALTDADHVLVLGHSLHDPALVNAIRSAKPKKLAVTNMITANDGGEQRAWMGEQLPEAIPMMIDFGPNMRVEEAAVETFVG